MTWEIWSVYAALCLAVSLTPGPAVLFVTSQSAWRGRAAGFAAVLGIESANIAYWTLTALGLAAVIAASQTLFMILKWAGALYLAWLGIQAIAKSFKPADITAPDARLAARHAYRDALIVGLSNPKAMLFFVALMPQFVNPAEPALAQIGVLAATGVAIDATVNSGYALAAGALRRAFSGSGVKRWLDRAIGGVFLSLAAVAALYRRAS